MRHKKSVRLTLVSTTGKTGKTILAHLHKLRLFGVSADVRRKTPRVYYHVAHLRTIQCFGVSADIRKILLLLKCDSCPNNTHDVLINQNRSFLRPYADTPNLDETLTRLAVFFLKQSW